MLHFLENHDEQRIASPGFVGDATIGKPAMVVSALIGRSPTMLYFGQDVGEPGDGDAGFGDPTRTTIFDYWGVPAHQRWMNGGAFDGGALSEDEKSLRDFYKRLMNFSATTAALQGEYRHLPSDEERAFAFARWNDDDRLVVVSNFDADNARDLELRVPAEVIESWQLRDGYYMLDEQLYRRNHTQLIVDNGEGTFRISLQALDSVVLKVGAPNISEQAGVVGAH